MVAFAEATAVATTQFARVTQYEDAVSWQLESIEEREPRMSWVVVTGTDGRRRLRIIWKLATQLGRAPRY